MFSPSLPISALSRCSTGPSGVESASSAATSAGARSATRRASSVANALNSSVLATKSVSLHSSTSAPLRRSALTSAAMRPSEVVRPAFLSALAMPFSRSRRAAASRSPPASSSARLQSIIPPPVRSRSSRTRPALISATSPPLAAAGLLGQLRARRSGHVRGGSLLGLGLGRDLGAPLGRHAFHASGSARRLRDLDHALAVLRPRLLGRRVLLVLREPLLVDLRADPAGLGQALEVEADRADRIVIARNRVLDAAGVAVGAHARDHRDA